MAAPTPPSWLNNEFLEEALRHEANDNSITVISSEIKPATAVGDNYGSLMYRAAMKIKRNNKVDETSVIIKSALTEGALSKLIQETTVFTKEALCFSSIMPAMSALLESKFPGKYQPFGAKYIYSTVKPGPTAIILEDLKSAGFVLGKVEFGLDLKHTLLAMRTLARFHSASLVLHQMNPRCFDDYQYSPQADEENKIMEVFLKTNVTGVAEEVETWDDFKDKYCKVLYSLADRARRTWIECVKRDDSGFNVLGHGDFWLNNMMFKYSNETGEVDDIRFVDFQISCWMSPAVDLQYFMNTSVDPDVLENREALIKEYYKTFCETLSGLGHENLQPSMETLNKELDKRCELGVLAGLSIRSVALQDKSKPPDLDKLFNKQGSFYLSDNYKQALRKLLPLYEKWGWLKP